MKLIRLIKKMPSHLYLSLGIFLFVFVFPIIDKSTYFDFIGPVSYSMITLSILSVIKYKNEKRLLFMHILIWLSILLIWLIYFTNSSFVFVLSFAFSILVFFRASIIMIAQIVKSKDVDSKLILEAINGYFLIGVMFTLTNTLIWRFNHNSIAIEDARIADFVYYSFITLTTIGYGDIYPISDFAKLSSVFFGISGQLYLTIIMAFIIGKFLNKQNK